MMDYELWPDDKEIAPAAMSPLVRYLWQRSQERTPGAEAGGRSTVTTRDLIALLLRALTPRHEVDPDRLVDEALAHFTLPSEERSEVDARVWEALLTADSDPER